MPYTVKYGDSLWRIAHQQLDDAERWPEIAQLNHIEHANRLILGQKLSLPDHSGYRSNDFYDQRSFKHEPYALRSVEHRPPLLPAWAHLFILADEFNPLTRKLVRKIVYPKDPTLTAEEIERILNPDKYGLTGRDPSSNVGLGLHVKGRTDSKYVSTSERALGADRFEGNRFWIDASKAEASGVHIHEAADINKDLDKLLTKSKSEGDKARIERIRKLSNIEDREVVLEGDIPALAVKGRAAMGLTRGFQVLEGIGLAFSAYDLGRASRKAYKEKSFVPLKKEGFRQSIGWTGSAVGRTAGRTAFTWAARWAAAGEGAELGGVGGAAVGIETGPGALITSGVGAFVFGTAAFFGADWATKKLFRGE